MMRNIIKASFFRKILLPAMLSILLFVISVFAFIIPSFEKNAVNQKQLMLKELTNTVWSILDKYHIDSGTDSASIRASQARAIAEIEALRYGTDKKDYFWITDLTPTMVMHPYVHELTGKSLNDFADPDGKKLFIEAVKIAQENGEGFIRYKWQFKDDSLHIVPKLSFVKKFSPWNWVIGTGIYLDDVQKEIGLLTNKLIIILIAITLIIALLIAFITWQSLNIENKRLAAERLLNESKERYRALVEASNEGALMVFEDYIYANKTMLNMLSYSENEISGLHIFDIVKDDALQSKYTGFQDMVKNSDLPDNYETFLRKKDGNYIQSIIAMSQISIAGKPGIIIIAKDITIQRMQIHQEGRIDFNASLADNFSIGFFKTTFSRKNRFIEASGAALKIFGFESGEDLLKTTIEDLFSSQEEQKAFARELISSGFTRRKIIKIKNLSGKEAYIAVSLIVREAGEGEKFCEGIVEDITDEYIESKNNEALMQSMLVPDSFMFLPVSGFNENPPACSMYTSIKSVCALMQKYDSSFILIDTPEGNRIGIVTDRDIRNRVVAQGHPLDKPVYEIMTSPVHTLFLDKPLFDAILILHDQQIDTLILTDSLGRPAGAFGRKEALRCLEFSHSFIIRKIMHAGSIDEIIDAHRRLKRMVLLLQSTDIGPEHITRLISSVADSITHRIFDLAIQELGKAPVEFTFISFGSVGRDEQTMATDQDNAIVYGESAEFPENEIHSYFMRLGREVCDMLAMSGYNHCKGGFMAKNPVWCKPISVWKAYFSEWVNTLVPQNLLDVSVLFDFRFSYGNRELAGELRQFVRSVTRNNDPFYYHLTENTLSIKLPGVFAGNIQNEPTKKSQDLLDIKKLLLPVVSFARIYALKAGCPETNTLSRLKALNLLEVLTDSDYQMISGLYRFLMRLRLKNQIEQIRNDKTPDNFVSITELSDLDRVMLKKVLSQIVSLYTRLSYDFKRAIG